MKNTEIKNIAKGNKIGSLLNGSCFGIKTETLTATIQVRMRAKQAGYEYRTGEEHAKITGRKCNFQTVIWK